MTDKPSTTVEYVIFDMDGLMIDSEHLDTEVINEILARYGKTLTWDIKASLMGKLEREAAEHLLSFFPGTSLTIDEYLRERDAAQDLRWPNIQLLPGVERLVTHLHGHGIPMAIATASRRAKFVAKTSRLGKVFGLFDGRVVCGDDGKVRPGRAKPCPDIFLTAAREYLGRDVGGEEVDECNNKEILERAKGLIFEDALLGVQAGKRAGMKVVWVPDPNLLDVEYTGPRPDETLNSLCEFLPEKYGLPPYDP
ncbi:HAD-like protein [Rickenella mellea]|uniref:HAD-like protein n=1 Tax=Rickenella mellea TaxID=50990 RepID=A0A4Y7QJ76_9AGAM|nr:HAD-like protein [Rickenella mellea]